jgi:DNA repair protein RecO (recombination protein O)
MKVCESKAFVLQSYPIQEADKICVLFTRDYGKVRGVARGARKLRNRFGASLEPLSEIALVYHEKEGRELVTIRSCELIRSLFSVETSPEGMAAIHYLVEFIDQFSPPHEPNEKIYRLINAVAGCLDAPIHEWSRVVLYFEVWVLKLSGFFPPLDNCVRCGRSVGLEQPIYVTAYGRPECLSCQASSGSIILPPFVRQELSFLLALPPSQWMKRRSDLRMLRPLIGFMRGLIRQVLEREMRAARFMKF